MGNLKRPKARYVYQERRRFQIHLPCGRLRIPPQLDEGKKRLYGWQIFRRKTIDVPSIITLVMKFPRNCPLCGGLVEDGLCIDCGYDFLVDGDIGFDKGKEKKKREGLLDILLGENDDSSSWPF